MHATHDLVTNVFNPNIGFLLNKPTLELLEMGNMYLLEIQIVYVLNIKIIIISR